MNLADHVPPKYTKALLTKDAALSLGRATYDDLWRFALPRRIPIRSRAAWLEIELPEPGIGLWRESFASCFICGKKEPPGGCHELQRLHVHHCQRRGGCHKPHQDWIVNLFLACVADHSGQLATMPHARQLAWKWRSDCAGFETLGELIPQFLMVRDGPVIQAPNRITVAEVEAELRDIEREHGF